MSKGAPFASGVAWLSTSISLFRSQAARLLLLGLLLQLLGGASQLGILALLFLLAAPALNAGMLEAMHRAAEDQRPSLMTLFAAFQGSGALLSLFWFGALGLLLMLLAMGFFVAPELAKVDPDLLGRIQSGDQNAVLELSPLLMQQVLWGMLLGLGSTLVLGFFAIPRIWFARRSLPAALWDGVLMGMRQWRALTVLGLLLGLLAVPVALLSGTVVAAQLGSKEPSLILTTLLLAVVVLYQVLGFAAQYVAYRSSFGIETGRAAPPAAPDQEPPRQDDQFEA